MFNKFYKFYKFYVNSPYYKNKTRILVGKDLRYNRIEYYNIISHLLGKNWILENKLIDIDSLIIKKLFRVVLAVLFFYITIYIFVF